MRHFDADEHHSVVASFAPEALRDAHDCIDNLSFRGVQLFGERRHVDELSSTVIIFSDRRLFVETATTAAPSTGSTRTAPLENVAIRMMSELLRQFNTDRKLRVLSMDLRTTHE